MTAPTVTVHNSTGVHRVAPARAAYLVAAYGVRVRFRGGLGGLPEDALMALRSQIVALRNACSPRKRPRKRPGKRPAAWQVRDRAEWCAMLDEVAAEFRRRYP